jgi:hypothetical protein
VYILQGFNTIASYFLFLVHTLALICVNHIYLTFEFIKNFELN